jgi:hypothetical protein
MTAVHVHRAHRETLLLRVLGMLAAMVSGPLWAMGITWTVVHVNGVAAGDIDADGRVAYALFWFALTCLLFFGSTVGYVAARVSRLSVAWSLIALQAALVAVATLTVAVALFR